MLRRLWKPWFVYRPTQLIRRLLAAQDRSGFRPLATSWGVPIVADPARAIGRSILTTGVHDIAVSEALARLIAPGDTVLDAGANVGYFTILSAVAAGHAGQVVAFEPHPGLFEVLQQNVASVSGRLKVAAIDLHNSALGERAGTGELHVPPDFAANDGLARVTPPVAAGRRPDGRAIRVPVETLDQTLGPATAAVLKLDVEGFESSVLRGAAAALAEKRIHHVVFEEHQPAGSEAVQVLRESGYHIFSIGWSVRGIVVRPMQSRSLARAYEAPSFIATVAPDEMLSRCRRRGWMVLSDRLVKRCS